MDDERTPNKHQCGSLPTSRDRSSRLTHYEKPPSLGQGISPFLPCGILADRSSPSRVRFAAKDAPLTAAGRSAHLSAKKEWGSLDWRMFGFAGAAGAWWWKLCE